MTSPLLNVSQVADLLKISVRSLYRMIENGDFPKGHRVAGSQRWYFDEVENAIRYGLVPNQKKSVSNSA